MFEALKRFGKFLKYGIQGLAALIVIISSLYEWARSSEVIIYLVAGLIFICIVEALARILVWVVSGYFESQPKANMSQKNLKQMREYYTCNDLRNKAIKLKNEYKKKSQ